MPSISHNGVGLAAFVVADDQLTKTLVRHFLSPCLRALSSTCAHLALGGHFMIVDTVNRGSAFGLRQGLWIWTALAVVGLVLVTSLSRGARDGTPAVVATALLAGGATGNLMDRLLFGGVTDFLGIRWGVHGGLVINVADVALAAGGLLAGSIVWKRLDSSFQPAVG